jgi:hemophore-related protein
MLNALWTRLVIASVGVSLSLTTGAAVALADPDMSPLINTTCSYPQAVAALNAEAPAAAQRLAATPMAQIWLRSFLASSPDQRQRLAQQIQNLPSLQQYVGVMQQVAGSCGGY